MMEALTDDVYNTALKVWLWEVLDDLTSVFLYPQRQRLIQLGVAG